MMGMSDIPYWLSWFAWFVFINTILCTTSWLILIIPVPLDGGPETMSVIGNSNYFLIWLYIWLYGIAIFGLIVFMQSFFSTAKYSGLLASLIYFGCFLLTITVQNSTSSKGLRVIMSIFP